MLRQIKLPISRIHSKIAKELCLCLLSAVLLILSFPQSNLSFFAWFGFVPLFFALQGRSKGKAFLLSYITGVIFWSGIIYWLIHVTLPGTIILVLYLALYFAFFGLLISYLLPTTCYLLFIPSFWVLLEYTRSHFLSGFPWALLGYSQYLNLPMIQIADITGAWGVSFLVMVVNTAIYSFLSSRAPLTERLKKQWLVVSIFIITFCYGYYKIHCLPFNTDHVPLKVSVIQGNIPQELKWDSRARNFIIMRYCDLTAETIKDKPHLIIWPEAALPAVLEEEPVYFDKVANFIKEINVPLLLGAVTSRGGLYYNSALLLSKEGGLLKIYDKIHLVPFGEYIPLRKMLVFLETLAPIGDIAAGKEHAIFKIPDSAGRPNSSFAVLICFEDLFPELSRRFVKRGAAFLVNITNDAWFGNTSSPYQHLSASVFRAVENRVFLVRSANTGVSGFISPEGRVISLIKDEEGKNTFITGHLTRKVCGYDLALSFYTRYGDLFVLGCFLFILSTTILILKKQK